MTSHLTCLRRFFFILMIQAVSIGSGLTAAQKSPSLIPQEQNEEGWIALFNGEDLTGWEAFGDPGEWTVERGVLTNVGSGSGWLGTVAAFGDFELIVDWKVSKGGNSGIFFRAGTTGRPWVNGYESQIDEDDEKNPTGSIYNHLKAEKVPTPDEEWHTTQIRAIGDQMEVKINGAKVAEGQADSFSHGRIGLQMHDDKTTVQFRKVWIRPLGLRTLFNGENFDGWNVKVAKRNDRPEPDIRVVDGAIRIQGGPGYVESKGDFSDFHVRLKIKTLPKGDKSSNSGVFLRGPRFPGDNFTNWPEGLECQVYNQRDVFNEQGEKINNGDFTSGGFYHHVTARDLYAQDEEWFWMDINVVENRYASWVNGMPAAVWVDEEDRFQDGVLGLQAHDPQSIIYYEQALIDELAPHREAQEE